MVDAQAPGPDLASGEPQNVPRVLSASPQADDGGQVGSHHLRGDASRQ
jgi:hypothetical protein